MVAEFFKNSIRISVGKTNGSSYWVLSIVENYYNRETVEQKAMFTLYKVRVKLMFTLYIAKCEHEFYSTLYIAKCEHEFYSTLYKVCT